MLATVAASSCGGGSSVTPDATIDRPDANPNPPDAAIADAAIPDAESDASPPDAAVEDGLVLCEQAVLPPLPPGTCSVTQGTGDAMLLYGTVLAPDGAFGQATVAIVDGRIACVGCDCAGQPAYADATRITCPDGVISPGLINAHDDLRFAEGSPVPRTPTRYDHRHGWRVALTTPENTHGTSETSAGMRWGELRMMFGGATSMVGAGRATGMLRNLDALEPADQELGLGELMLETFPLGDQDRTFRPSCQWSYANTERAVAGYSAYLPHVAEGIDDYANEEFRCQSSSLGGARDHTAPNTAHIHGIGLRAADYYRMARDQAQLIWSPRSNVSLYGMTADVITFHRLGGVIALGTDWMYSGSANVPRELACADSLNRTYLDGYFTDRQLWEMVTGNAARATGTDELVGALAPGMLADIAVFARRGRTSYRAVIEASSADVALVLKAGVPLYGDADALAALGQDCEAVDVCGEQRAVCARREFGVTFAQIQSEVMTGTPAYPAIFCAAPASEPTCVPTRPNEYTQISASDIDGDGVANIADNCRDVFNPIRPLENGVQADADLDGVGDACDPTPIRADVDGDGVANDVDLCPFDADPAQADADRDGKGDVCDSCPDLANPDSICPPRLVSIPEIRLAPVPVGTSVRVDSVVVTGRTASAVAVQDFTAPTADSSGIWVYTGADPGVAIGDVVHVQGEVDDSLGLLQINHAVVTRVSAGTPPSPVDVTVAQAAAEEYESVLVRLTDIDKVEDPWDCTMDDPSCADVRLWQVSGGDVSVLVYDRLYAGADWAAQAGKVPVTGVMTFRYDRRRIQPRVAADLGQ